MKIQSTPLINIGNTEGIKDIKSDSYTASKIQTINSDQWESNGNAQGATSVIKRMVSAGTSVRKPANPTKMTSIKFTAPMDISKGTSVTVNLANAGYENVYDCTTWDYYRTEPTYDYVGYFASSHSKETETKTMLVQK